MWLIGLEYATLNRSCRVLQLQSVALADTTLGMGADGAREKEMEEAWEKMEVVGNSTGYVQIGIRRRGSMPSKPDWGMETRPFCV